MLRLGTLLPIFLLLLRSHESAAAEPKIEGIISKFNFPVVPSLFIVPNFPYLVHIPLIATKACQISKYVLVSHVIRSIADKTRMHDLGATDMQLVSVIKSTLCLTVVNIRLKTHAWGNDSSVSGSPNGPHLMIGPAAAFIV